MNNRLAIAFVVGGFAATIATEGQVKYRVDDPGRWRPWQFNAVASVKRDRAATPAEVQAFEARLVALAQILKRTPIVAQPVGFAVGTHGYMAGYAATAPGQPPGRTLPLAGGLGFGAFSIFEYVKGGKPVVEESIATELLYFEVNQIQALSYSAGKPEEWGPLDTEGFIEPAAGTSFAGQPRAGEMFVIKKNPKPLWIPFLLGDAVQPVVTLRREEFERRRDAFDKQAAEFVTWQTPAARAARRADWQKTAAMIPNGAEFLKNMEKSDVEIEAATRARLASGGPDAKTVAAAEREFRDAEMAFAALTPEARASAACYDATKTALSSRFRAAEGAPSSCRPLVRPNWAYFDPKLPRAAPQVVMLGLFTRCLTPESLKATIPGGCVINRKLVETLDWDAVRAWLDK